MEEEYLKIDMVLNAIAIFYSEKELGNDFEKAFYYASMVKDDEFISSKDILMKYYFLHKKDYQWFEIAKRIDQMNMKNHIYCGEEDKSYAQFLLGNYYFKHKVKEEAFSYFNKSVLNGSEDTIHKLSFYYNKNKEVLSYWLKTLIQNEKSIKNNKKEKINYCIMALLCCKFIDINNDFFGSTGIKISEILKNKNNIEMIKKLFLQEVESINCYNVDKHIFEKFLVRIIKIKVNEELEFY